VTFKAILGEKQLISRIISHFERVNAKVLYVILNQEEDIALLHSRTYALKYELMHRRKISQSHVDCYVCNLSVTCRMLCLQSLSHM